MRTFIAIELPREVRDTIRQRQTRLRSILEQAGLAACFRWSAVESIHLTLRFLGETDTKQTERIEAGLGQAGRRSRPFSLCIGRTGCFPNFRQPNVLWLGVDGDLALLAELQRSIEGLAQSAGFEAEVRAFSPHLTLARAHRERFRAELRAAGALLEAEAGAAPQGDGPGRPFSEQPVCFTVVEVVHMRSDLRPAGPIYTPLSVHLLGD